jgi:hypothetical protein
MDRALVVEISTQKVNKNSIEWFTYFSKLHNVDKTNYILPDRIHTIPRWLLTDGNKLKTRTIPQDIKIKIENFVKDVFNNE